MCWNLNIGLVNLSSILVTKTAIQNIRKKKVFRIIPQGKSLSWKKKINNKCESGSMHWVTSHTLVSDWRIWQCYNWAWSPPQGLNQLYFCRKKKSYLKKWQLMTIVLAGRGQSLCHIYHVQAVLLSEWEIHVFRIHFVTDEMDWDSVALNQMHTTASYCHKLKVHWKWVNVSPNLGWGTFWGEKTLLLDLAHSEQFIVTTFKTPS